MSLLITVEGLDGTGKTTLVEALTTRLHEEFLSYWFYASKEPGSMWTGKTSKQIREMVLSTPDFRPLEREILFMVDASLHTRFISNQGNNAVIVSDRGLWSHLAYLRGYLKTKAMDYDDYKICTSLIDRLCTKPDCVIYLQGSLDLMKERLSGKKKDVIESQGEDFFKVVAETYENLSEERQLNGLPFLLLDANAPTCTNLDKIVQYLKRRFFYDSATIGSNNQ